jgi:hypothetical protein
MSTHEQDEVCAAIINKMALGQSLNATEKAHLSQCAGCMREVVLHLDQAVTTENKEDATDTIPTGGAARAATALPEEVRLALEHGRHVLEREFGIRAGSKPGPSI